MGKVFAFTNPKGGVGKSTLAVHLTVWLREQGIRVALVDADVQGSSSGWLKEASPEVPQFRVQTPDEVLEQLPVLREQFDSLVLDGPAGLSEVTRAALFVADVTYLPCGPSVLDLRAVSDALRVVRQAQGIRKGPPDVVLIPNKLQKGFGFSRLSQELLKMPQTLNIPATSGLRLRQAYADAAGQGTVVWRLGINATEAAHEMKTLLEEMLSYDSTPIAQPSVANG